MIDAARQPPAPNAAAWAIDLTRDEGLVFVVLRLAEDETRAALVRHLVEIGSLPKTEAERVVGVAPAESVAVVW